MNRIKSMLRGAALGALAAHFFDPEQGRRRRALIRDRLTRLPHALNDAIETTRRDLANRLEGLRAGWERLFRSKDPSDRVIAERVRSRLGRLVSNPGSIDVKSKKHCVSLSGPVFSDELDELLSTVRHVRGVEEVDAHLEPHERSESHPGLQGKAKRTEGRGGLLGGRWSPTTRFLAGAAGSALLLRCIARPGLGRALPGTLGFAVLLRAATNTPLEEVLDRFEESITGERPEPRGRHGRRDGRRNLKS